jgi:peptidoglycan/LPS O-acetylase OafA/YrhL
MSSATLPAAKRQLEWLDYARFAAAMAVVAYHYLAQGPRDGKTGVHTDFGLAASVADYGYLGVELFFIISGFVVLYSALGRTADRFAVSRAVRLWPTFVVCMTLSALVMNVFGGPDAHVTLIRYLANLTMAPSMLGQKAVDGVYWTLLYEIIFYSAIFVVLLLGQIHRIAAIVAGWTVLLLLQRVVGLIWPAVPTLPLLGDWFDLFAAGALLAVVRRDGWRAWSVIAMVVLVALSAQGVWTRAAVMAIEHTLQPAIAAAIVVACFLPFLLIRGDGPRLPLAGYLGRLTYPLYLVHARVGFALLAMLTINSWLAVAVTTAVVIALASLVYLGFEETTQGPRNRWMNATLGAAIRWAMALFSGGGRKPQASPSSD